MRTIHVLSVAANEAEAATEWYERERPGLGRDFELAVDAALDLLACDPIPASAMPDNVSAMKHEKSARLRANGWKVGSADEFLGLSEEESKLVNLKGSLIDAVKKTRIRNKLSQIELAQRMQSSQSRIAKLEAGDPSVSLDLIVRALIAGGATKRDIQAAFSSI